MLSASYHNNALVELPDWARDLHFPYWKIRVEGRDPALRRRYYRQIRKIKIRLVEQGHDTEEIRLICRYLVSYSYVSRDALVTYQKMTKSKPKQLELAFF